MSDRTTIEIDCERHSVSISGDYMGTGPSVGSLVSLTRSYMIASIISAQIKTLLHMSRKALVEAYIEDVSEELEVMAKN